MYKKLILEDFRIFKNQEIEIGEIVTAIAGHNATGKSTILGILGNSSELKSKFGTTITDKSFKTEFSELFRGSKEHDKANGNIGKIVFKFMDKEEKEIGLRVTWQKWGPQSTEKNRFRIIPKWIEQNGEKPTAKKLPLPSFYLGLSRLYPLGENNKEFIEEKRFKNTLTPKEYEWLINNYKHILSINADVNSISNFELIKKRSGGVNTNLYDYQGNSSGQDNLMQIMYLLLSFIRLKQKNDRDEACWNGGLLLIDEVDATLHPAAQIRLVELIYSTSKEYQFQSIFTTHSLQILSYLKALQIRNSGISIEYFTTANNTLQIIHNPSYQVMENDMLISNYYLNNSKQKILVYSEDKEARWFIAKLLDKYKDRIQLVDIKLGCDSLMDLLANDPDYFKTVLFVLDGDADLSTTKYRDLPRTCCNILNLPGGKNPEEVLYDYLINLPAKHNLLLDNLERGLTIRAFAEMNPERNPKYTQFVKKREKYKEWFKESLIMFDDINLYEYWAEDNVEAVNDFVECFVNRYNIVASRCNLPKIR